MILRLIKERNLVLGLIQKSLIENSVQDCLPYILLAHSLYSSTLAYSKWPYVKYARWYYYTKTFYVLPLWPYDYDSIVIAWTCGQTLGLGLGQSKDIVVVFY